MKEVRADRKEYEKCLRLGMKPKVQTIVQKYGVDFTNEDNTSGLMMALYYGQTEIALNLLMQGASTIILDKSRRLAVDYLLDSYLKNRKSKQKQIQLADERTLAQCWERIRPQALVYESGKREFRLGFHSMLFFLMILLRNASGTQNTMGFFTRRLLSFASHMAESPLDAEHRTLYFAGNQYPVIAKLQQEAVKNGVSEKDLYSVVCKMADAIPIFTMDDLVELTELFPDEILPPYRKKRQYINSIMALNEILKTDSPYCKEAFVRVGRGMYILNQDIVF
jgi:hypothetical protein